MPLTAGSEQPPSPSREMTPRERLLLYPGMFVCLASMLVYLFVNYRHYINSDSASVVLLAEDIIRSGQWIPSSWQYVSDGIPVLSNSQLAIPFVAWLGPSVFAHALTAACGAALMLFGLFQLGRSTSLGREWSFLGATIVLSGTSMIYADLLLGQMVSVEVAKLALFLAALLRLAQGRSVSANLGLACALLAIQFTASPRKALAFFLLPTFAALLLQAIVPWDRRAVRCNPQAALALLLAALVGVGVHQWLAGQLSVNTQYASFEPAAGVARVGNNLLMFRELAFKFLDLGGDGPALPIPAHWLSDLSRTASATAFIAGVGLCAWHALRERNQSLLMLAAFVVTSITTILGGLLLGSGIKPYYGIYYLVYAGAPAAFLLVHALLRASRLQLPIILLGLTPALLLSAKTYVLSDPMFGARYSGPGINQTTDNQDKQQLIDWLNMQRLSRGYALFWDANAITVLSGGHTRVAPVNKSIESFMWLTSTTSIKEVRHSDRIFVAVPRVNNARLPADCRVSSTHEVGIYRVDVLDRYAPGCGALRSRHHDTTRHDTTPRSNDLRSGGCPNSLCVAVTAADRRDLPGDLKLDQ